MAQQTAVDFFYNEVWICYSNKLSWSESERLNKIQKQAKEIEKQQHEETALSIVKILLDNLEGKNDLGGKEAFEQIWNKTYGGNK